MSCVLLVEMVVVLLVLAKEVRVLLCLLDVLQPTAWHPLNTFIVQSFPRLMILSLFIHPYTMVKPQCLPREIAFVMKVVAFYKQSKSWHLLQFLKMNNRQNVLQLQMVVALLVLLLQAELLEKKQSPIIHLEVSGSKGTVITDGK